MSDVPYRFPEERRPVRWGTALAGFAIFVIVGVFAFSYVYLWADAEAWPPAGHDPIELVPALLAAGLVLVAAIAGLLGSYSHGPMWHLLLAVAWIAGGASIAVMWMLASELRPTDHAYGSMSMLLVASALVVAAVASVAAALVQLRSLGGAPPEWLGSGRMALRVLWIVAVVVMAATLATAVAIPHVSPR